MSCTYYWWNNHYACRKSGKDVGEDIYYKYCRNYDYSDCPIYKGKLPSDNGNCYLSTACTAAKGLPDDCIELTTLRWFRDFYVMTTEQGRTEINHYYAVAPKIVSAIERNGNAKNQFATIYEELIVPCVKLIQDGRYEEAYERYKNYSFMLEDTYGI